MKRTRIEIMEISMAMYDRTMRNGGSLTVEDRVLNLPAATTADKVYYNEHNGKYYVKYECIEKEDSDNDTL